MILGRSATVALAAACILAAVGCTGEEAVPIDQLPPQSTTPTTHFLEPNEEMRDLATQQCLDDPELDEGLIEAVDPDDPSNILLTVTVDCDEVR